MSEKTVIASVRYKRLKKRSLHEVNEYFEFVFNDVIAENIRLVKLSFKNKGLQCVSESSLNEIVTEKASKNSQAKPVVV